MSKKNHLIIGSGPAALSAVDQIRCLNRDDDIKVVSKEGTRPYSPSVLPYLLAGRTAESDIWLRDEAYFKEMNVTFASNKEVIKILPDQKQIVYHDGGIDEYDNLLIASGARPATLPVKGLNENGFLNFHTLDDYSRLNGMLSDETEVAVLGAGMVAMELVMALVERGNKVRIVGRGRPLRVYFDEQAGGYIRDIYTDRGVEISTGKSISEVKKNGAGIEVHCADGEVFRTDILVSCLGVIPSLSFIEGSGIAINQGVLVDERMKTNMEDVYAAGDVAEAPDFFHNQPGISAILPSAIAQGKVAGANMAGEECCYKGWIAMNQLKIFGNSACSIGIAMPGDGEGEVLEEKNDDTRYFKRLVVRNNKLIGAMFINVNIDPGVIRYLIEKRVDIGTCREALFEQPAETGRWLMLENERKATI